VRWRDLGSILPAAAAADDDDDVTDDITVDDGIGDGVRFEFVLSNYWPDVTEMTLQCAVTTCTTVCM